MKKYILTSLFAVISTFFLIYLIFNITLDKSFSENTGLYFFSSLIQANAAILSIIGVFYIFRLQSIQVAISNIFNALFYENITIREGAEDFKNKSLDDKKTYVSRLTAHDHISNSYRNWLEYEIEQNDIKERIKNPLITITVLIILQVIFLIISNGIHSLGIWSEIITYLIVGLFQIYVLVIVVKSIILIINRKNV
ncbi:MAG: hypothetical protein IPJ03_11635 [Ignavibacteriales bacterium]|nr:hypothetical protein [Ignavibacteriales bacterium]